MAESFENLDNILRDWAGTKTSCRGIEQVRKTGRGMIKISGRFRQFYFLQKTRITKMKNALKSRSLFVFYPQKKRKDTFF